MIWSYSNTLNSLVFPCPASILPFPLTVLSFLFEESFPTLCPCGRFQGQAPNPDVAGEKQGLVVG